MADFTTTPSTQYGHTRLDFAVGAAGGFVILPAEDATAEGNRWIWYAPTFIHEPHPLPKPLHAWYLEPILEAGVAVAGVDVGESWGSPAGRATFTEFHRIVTEQFSLAREAILMPQSRGGLMHYNWAAEHPDCVRCIGGIYPVCDVTRPIRIDTVAKPYGLTPSQLLEQLDQHNPLDRLAPLAAAGVPILHVHGAQDEPVPLESNSAELVRRYRDLGGAAELIVIEGKGHEEVREYFQCPQLLDFFLSGGATVG